MLQDLNFFDFLHVISLKTVSKAYCPSGATALLGPMSPHCRGFQITLKYSKLGTAALDE